jgi:hypothetical protein
MLSSMDEASRRNVSAYIYNLGSLFSTQSIIWIRDSFEGEMATLFIRDRNFAAVRIAVLEVCLFHLEERGPPDANGQRGKETGLR